MKREVKKMRNRLCQEFLHDILNLTSSCPDENDFSELQKYLLEGRGWKLLSVIQKCETKPLVWAKDFSNLLVTLLPFCLKFSFNTEEDYTNQVENDTITTIEPLAIELKSPLKHMNFSYNVPFEYIGEEVASAKQKSNKVPKGRRVSKNIILKTDDSSDDESSDCSPKHRKSVGRKSQCTAFSPKFMKEHSNTDDSDELEELDNLTNYISETKINTITSLDLCLLILDLITFICSCELKQKVPSKILSTSLLPAFLHCLSCFYSCEPEFVVTESSSWPKHMLICIQRKLAKIVLQLCSSISSQQNGVNVLLGHKVIETFLNAAKQLMTNPSDSEDATFAAERTFLISDLVVCSVYCLDAVFKNIPLNPSFINNAICMAQTFEQNFGFKLINYVLKFYDSISCEIYEKQGDRMHSKSLIHEVFSEPQISEEVKNTGEQSSNNLISVVRGFINTMKLVRVSYIHTIKCFKRTHKHCHFSIFFNHHHNVLGKEAPSAISVKPNQASSSSVDMSNTSICLIALWSQSFIQMLKSVENKQTQMRILSSLYTTGLCCCMYLEDLVSTIIELLPHQPADVQNFSLDALMNILLQEFVALSADSILLKGKENLVCHCFDEVKTKVMSCKDRSNIKADKTQASILDSGFSSSDHQRLKKLPDVKTRINLKWWSLKHFKLLLLSKNETLVHITARHLLHFVSKANVEIKEILYYGVYSDLLDKILSTVENATDTVSQTTMFLLTALPLLIETISVAKHFISKINIAVLYDCLDNSNLNSILLQISEKLIMIHEEVYRNESAYSTEKPSYDDSQIIQTFIESVDIKSKQNLSCLGAVDQEYEECEDCTVGTNEEWKKGLSVMITPWKTCARLCLSSSSFLRCFCESVCFGTAQKLLLFITHSLEMSNLSKLDDTLETPDPVKDEEKNDDPGLTAVHFLKMDMMEPLLVLVCICYRDLQVDPPEDFWSTVTRCLYDCDGLSVVKQEALLDMLLRAANPKSMLDNFCCTQTSDISEILNEDEGREEIKFVSDEIDLQSGYEADIETSSSDESSGSRAAYRKSNLSSKSLQLPEIYEIILALLIKLQEKDDRCVVHHALLGLSQTLRNNRDTVHVICRQGFLEKLIHGFQRILKCDAQENSEMRSLLLSIIQHLAEVHITSTELQDVMRLFLSHQASMDIMLSTLLNIIENTNKEASCCVSFPAMHSPVYDASNQGSKGSSNAAVSETSKLSSLFSKLGFPHASASQSSKNELKVMNIAAIQIDLKDCTACPLFIDGFTYTAWFKANIDGQIRTANSKKNIPDGLAFRGKKYDVTDICLHLLSVGTQVKMFETWIDHRTKTLLFRITSAMTETDTVLVENIWESAIRYDRWHHLTVTYSEVYEESDIQAKVIVTIDGSLSKAMIMKYSQKELGIKFKESPRCFIGHSIDDNQRNANYGKYDLSTCSLFRGGSMTKEECFHLYTLGPDCRSISKCDCSDVQCSYSPHISKDVILHSGIKHDSLVGIKHINLDKLRMSQLFVYNSQFPDLVNMYGTNNSIDSMPVMSSLRISRPLVSEFNLLSQQPRQIMPNVKAELQCTKTNTLEKSIEHIGGIDCFTFFVAKVFEMAGSNITEDNRVIVEKIQAKSLKIFFTLLNHCPKLTVEYDGICAMLCKVLSSSHSAVGVYTLKAVIDACLSEPLFRIAALGEPVLRKNTEAIVCNVDIISHLLLYWKIWEKAESAVIDLLFLALEALVREDHPYKDFNVKQFQVGNIMQRIFHIYQERIQDGLPSTSVTASIAVVNIIQSLHGAPPDFHMLVLITDFLLLVHPAASTFINHSRSGFYFNLWWNNEHMMKSAQEEKRNQEETVNKKQEDMTNFLDYDQDSQEIKTQGSVLSDGQLDQSITNDLSQASKSDSDSSLSSQTDNVLSDHVTDETATATNSAALEINEFESSLEETRIQSRSKSTFAVPNSSERITVVSAMNNEIITFDETNIDIVKNEKGLVILIVGLLNHLDDIVLTLPDSLVEKLFRNVLKSQIIIILAHNSSPQIRSAVIKLLQTYLTRSNAYIIDEFLKNDGFHLLGTQLFQYPAYEELMESAISVVLGKKFSFDKESEWSEHGDFNYLQQSSVVLMLALLEKSLHDISVVHNTITFISQLFSVNASICVTFMEEGLIEVLLNMLASIFQKNICTTDVVNFDEYHIIIEDIQSLFCIAAVKVLSLSGDVHFHMFDDVLSLLTAFTQKQMTIHGLVNLSLFETSSLSSFLFLLAPLLSMDQSDNEPIIVAALSSENHTLLDNVALLFDNHTLLDDVDGVLLAISSENKDTKAIQIKYTGGATSKRIIAVRALQFSIWAQVLEYIEQKCEESNQNAALWFPVYREQTSPEIDDMQSSYSSGRRGSSDLTASQWSKRSYSADMTSSKGKDGPFSGKISLGRKTKKTTSAVQLEFIDRMKKLILQMVNFLVFNYERHDEQIVESKKVVLLFETSPNNFSNEQAFERKLLDFLFRAFKITLDKTDFGKGNKNTIMWAAKDVTRVQLGRLLVHMLSSCQKFEQRVYTVSYLMKELKGKDVFRLVASHVETGNAMLVFLHHLQYQWKDWLAIQQANDLSCLLNILKSSGLSIISKSSESGDVSEILKKEIQFLHNIHLKEKDVWIRRKNVAIDRAVHKFDKFASQLSAKAMETTQVVTRMQTTERSKFVEYIKKSMTEKIQLKKNWQELVLNLTHERAIWYCPESYPQSWQLDPTEGPSRVRKRLQRCHLGINEEFLSEESKDKIRAEKMDPPLVYLFEDDHQMSDSAALIYRLYSNEKIQCSCHCTAVSPASESKGELFLGENSVFFVADEAITDANYTQVLLGNKDELAMTWPLIDFREFHKRWFQLRDIGLEIFLTNGKTCLLAFENGMERDSMFDQLSSLELPNLIGSENLIAIQRLWLDGHLTNFEYLTNLNKIAGRSFNDLMQYPVFPFILNDYFSEQLDLSDARVYRDLSKPISVQNKSKEQKYIENYEVLKQEHENGDSESKSMGYSTTPYHYGSHYSNSGTVLHYLVRLPPFTQMFLRYQDNHFDIPDRTFHSLEVSYRLSSFLSSTDVKEIIPEFFFLPDFLWNGEEYNFGRKQDGKLIWGVSLPPWCDHDPRKFILIHRQSLESAIVTKNIHSWIDLVFGSKQQGEEAIKAVNVFHPATYFGVDVDSIKDPLKKQALFTMIRTYGQTPKQLFKQSHPTNHLTEPMSSALMSQLFQQMSSSNTTSEPHMFVPSPLSNVSGLQWGNIVGSPSLPPPVITWRDKYQEVVASLVPLPTDEVFGIGINSCFLVMYTKVKAVTGINQSDVVWAAIAKWGYSDGILRIINERDKPPINFLHYSCYDEITCCTSVYDCRLLFIGGTLGVITVYNTAFNNAKESDLQVFGKKKCLYGHKSRVTALLVCKSYSLLVSASEDGSIIIWDLNRLSYIRSITSHKKSVEVISISETLGDIASVSNKGFGSNLQLHTINAQHIASQLCESRISCLSYSNAPEGKSVNLIAGGMSNGIIRLWSSWNLLPVRDLCDLESPQCPVVSVTFTVDSQRLFVSRSDGTVLIWQIPSQIKDEEFCSSSKTRYYTRDKGKLFSVEYRFSDKHHPTSSQSRHEYCNFFSGPAPTLYPTLSDTIPLAPSPELQVHRLQQISEIQNHQEREKEKRASLYKRYHRLCDTDT